MTRQGYFEDIFQSNFNIGERYELQLPLHTSILTLISSLVSSRTCPYEVT